MGNNKTVEFTALARAFNGQCIRLHRFSYDGCGLRVYDPIAGHYTACHSLTDAAMRRLVKLATMQGEGK